MGWTNIHRDAINYLMGSNPAGDLLSDIVPFFHEQEDGKADLLRWLAEDHARWVSFEDELIDVLNGGEGPSVMVALKQLLTCTPAQVATAALKSLGLED